MTPAVNLLKKNKVTHRIHHYDHDPDTRSFGEEAADKLGLSHDRIFKTLVVSMDDHAMAIALVPVSRRLNLKKMARTMKTKKIGMAEKKVVERITGYLPGGVSPLGQKKRLPTVIDSSALDFQTIFVSAGRRGLQVELAPGDLVGLLGAQLFEIAT